MDVSETVCFHTEALHDDQVWDQVERVAGDLARRGHRVTFFVYPFRASVAGIDIGDRVRQLAALGHEIAQHSHFYSGHLIAGPNKRNDFSPENVRLCIERDRTALRAMGSDPVGFTSGGWAAGEPIFSALAEAGFAYDCSTRVGTARETDGHGMERWQPEARLRAGPGSMLLLPTSCSLGQYVRAFGRAPTAAPGRIRLIYLHDYDMNKAPVRIALKALILRSARRPCRL